jgi:transcriptional regulator with GAF, ATPase, and Fis domain
MRPRIVVFETGEEYPIPDEEFVIGRDEKANLSLPDPLVSRRHCVIHDLQLHECGSLNGTRLNGRPVIGPEPLGHGDRIDVGETPLVFLTEDDASIQTDFTPPRAPKMTVLANSNVLLASLIQGAGALCKLRDTASIQKQIFSIIFSATPADRAALSLNGAWTFRDRGGEGTPFAVDRDAPGATLCVPIETPGMRGLIYAEVCEPDSYFNAGHVELLSGMAAIAGLAFEHASYIEQLEVQNLRLRQDLELRHEMVGDSPAMAALMVRIAQVAPVDTAVLIQGETGTGKELVARAIHRNSKRAAKSFVALNCGAISESLIESELFGYERGAFTGAAMQKKGLIEEASGGTLFLDEVGELSLPFQVKLLRVLQEHEIRRVGSAKSIPVDIRLISATNRDLAKEVAEKRFREDLFYRLNVVCLKTPPLRERREEIPVLARHFVQKIGKKLGRVMQGISKEAETLLMQYSWPGNVRELENVIERAIVLGAGPIIRPEELPLDVFEGSPVTIPYLQAVDAAKREIILRAVRAAGEDMELAAERLGVARPSLYKLINKLNVKL